MARAVLTIALLSAALVASCSREAAAPASVAAVDQVCIPPVSPHPIGLRRVGGTQIGNVRFPRPGHYEMRAGAMSVVPAAGTDVESDLLASVIRVPSAQPLEWKLPGSTAWERVPLEYLTPPRDAEQLAAEGIPLKMRSVDLTIGMGK